MNISKKGLGRGLSSLMGEDVNKKTISQTNINETKIALSKLKPSSIQPRRLFDKNSINELAESIKSKGLVQPILVRPSKYNSDEFEIIAGERRWRAAQIAQLHELPAVVKNLDDIEALEMAIIENVQRADLSPIEEASGYKKLMEQYNHTQEALAPIVGKSRSHIANIIRLLNLPNPIQDLITQGIISPGHARAIMNSAFPEQLAKKIVDENLSVRQVEKLVKNSKDRVSKIKLKPTDTIDLEEKLAEILGLEVIISDNGKRGGNIKVKYKTLDQLALVTNKLKM
jgi:ParB family chromosome partitioning protein